jgi:Rrf2 family protein
VIAGAAGCYHALVRFTAQEEYGLRCLLQIARHAPVSASQVTVAEIAERESLTPAYVAKLLRILRQSGLIEGTRGQKGGYHLSKPATEISVGEVLASLGGTLYSSEFCERHAGTGRSCVHSTDCSIRSLWSSVDGVVSSILGRCSLQDLLGPERGMEVLLKDKVEQAQADSADAPAAKSSSARVSVVPIGHGRGLARR